MSDIDQSRKFSDEGDMFRDVAAEFAELGVLVDKAVLARMSVSVQQLKPKRWWEQSNLPLHICDGLYFARLGGHRSSRVVLHVRREMSSEVAKVVVQVVGKKGILLWRQDNLLST